MQHTSTFLIFTFCVLVQQVCGQVFSVSLASDGSWELNPGKTSNYIAVASVQLDVNLTGWATLDIVTNAAVDDSLQAYAAGYIEGALTTDMIYNAWITQLEYEYNGALSAAITVWLQKNDAWVRSQVQSCVGLTGIAYDTGDCGYWHQVGLVIDQLDGMVQGYNDHCAPNKALSADLFLYMNAIADIITDLMPKFNVSAVPKTVLEIIKSQHCSVLVKYAADTQELYHGHATWLDYPHLLRVYKHHTFHFSHPTTQTTTVSFSSYPALIPSTDDFYITDSGLIVTETTNGIFNMSLYNYVQETSVLCWIRVVVANRMSSNGSQWVNIFAKYNSGTYNNQWQITDTKLFQQGSPLVPGTLHILEQIPGYCESADVTDLLITNGYFPSYNIPYFEYIYNISGFPEAAAKYGDAMIYQACPRANIFRRDQGKVAVFQDMQKIMRFNDYQTDPLSLGNPCNSVASRCDLLSVDPQPFGALDCKVTSYSLAQLMISSAISGPTTESQPVFSWTGPFASVPHYGQPALFNFSFEIMSPIIGL